ncbi:hypothetical protein SRB5_14890 [Streptomyces sp. RB5]|uniref:N-acetyltransferase domain-containing protein n=1 Tax=Streptomyces smaragdinus TaxID=2585196 RepID=A0A7K0CDE3_9ACTN|nr:GNAT family N-acetyltransferase [Streptomyces smaragdinus]MQY11373.1 hypothetical protein [Streptomyces smaragdinus]
MGDLATKRLVLHPLTRAEAEEILTGSPGAHWAPDYPTPGDTIAANRYLSATADPFPFGNFEIRLRADGRAIGGLGFHGPMDTTGTVTIGYGLIPSARGKGYASEALRALLEFARSQGAVRVKGDADHANVASHRVMLAAGMRAVGEDERVRYFEVSWADE